jgi:hypothetical protein
MTRACVKSSLRPDPADAQPIARRVSAARFAGAIAGGMRGLDAFRRRSEIFTNACARCFFFTPFIAFICPAKLPAARRHDSVQGLCHLLQRRFEEALENFLTSKKTAPATPFPARWPRVSALGFQTLADQVRRSVRSVRGNQWMFRMGHPMDHPLRLRPNCCNAAPTGYPVLRERTPVRMDLSHSAAGATFFFSAWISRRRAGAECLIDLGVHGRDRAPQPPVEVYACA